MTDNKPANASADRDPRLLEDFFTKVLSVIGKTTDREISEAFRENKQTVSVAESLTGGLICSRLANVPGSSDYFIGGIVCYHNRIKVTLVGVPPALIADHGPVSKEVAIAMAEGIRNRLKTNIGLSATGSAGPAAHHDGTKLAANNNQPIGLVHIALASDKGTEHKELHFQGARNEIREKAAQAALGLLWLHLGGEDALFEAK